MQPVYAIARRRKARLWILSLTILALLAAVFAPPLISVNGFHRRIADSISQAVGRPVRMSSIQLRLLPRPGFEIADFVVDEDPAFGAEPILRSSQVIASIRLLSLWRGRLEIARIAFDEPSLNLVRNRQGRWNFDSVLSQAAQIPNAPTAERHPGGLPRFPYIEASSARVNFKRDDEKLPFSFFSADLAVWLEKPGEWRIQFAAQPVRTDLTLDPSNTGTFRLEGSLHQAAKLTQMPAQLHVEWSNVPLGQLSRLVAGSDADWRGELNATADITGTADHASIKIDATGSGIHRAEFEPHQPLNLEVTCQANFTRAVRLFDAVTCLAPTGDGHLLLTGSVQARSGETDPELSLEINHLPVAMAVDGLRLVRSGFAPAVEATGAIDGNFTYSVTPDAPQPQLRGQAAVNNLTLVAPELLKPFALPVLHLSTNAPPPPRPRRRGAIPASSRAIDPAAGTTLLLSPFSIGPASAAVPPLTIGGSFDHAGFSVAARGQSRIGQVVALGREFGLLRSRTVAFAPVGTADVDLTIHGPWLVPISDPSATPATLDGSIRLRNAQLTGDFLARPLEIGSAQATFAEDRIDWIASSMIYGPIHADGTLSYPAFCDSPPACDRHFNLHIATLDAAIAQSALLGTDRHGELVQRLIDRVDGENRSWPSLSGTAQIGTLALHDLAIHDVAASLSLSGNVLQIASLTGHTLDGDLHLSGAIDLSSGTPRYHLNTQVNNASASSVASLFQEKWGPGTISVAATLELSGFDLDELVSSTTGTFHWDWANGGLGLDSASSSNPPAKGRMPIRIHSQLANAGLAHFDSWVANGTIAQSALKLRDSTIANGSDTLPLTGTLDFARTLHLASSGAARVKITGTLQHPESNVAPAANKAD